MMSVWLCSLSLLVFAPKIGAEAHGGETRTTQEPAPNKEQALDSPVGTWRTICDKDNKPRSLVRITERNGRLTGTITRIIRRPHDPEELKCELCRGSLKDAPVEGLRILWDFQKKGKRWTGGRILDPENGKTYKCTMELERGGKQLRVRGYVGVRALGRTQIWHRVDD